MTDDATVGGPVGIPPGYEAVDPRTARRVPLWRELGPDTPIFPGDPPFTFDVFTTLQDAGYLLERITSLGTHTGTHISAPAHFVEGGPGLNLLDESWTLMPLAVIDVRAEADRIPGGLVVGVDRLRAFEGRYGRIPAGACVLMLTGFRGPGAVGGPPASRADEADVETAAETPELAAETAAEAPGFAAETATEAPGFAAEAVAWLFEERGIVAVGSDTFGPDAGSDAAYSATATALRHGGITVENVGPGLAGMRPFGDWVSVNGARPPFSGFPVGITGFTLP